ncbi:hypothetical protein D8N35_16960 [Enterococcus casseliflavus]|uniref:hypothetical protein n=1 Tax=Enterococcus casseliflavus TaxID=37734 RepID=UPI000EAB93D2|nr:hypothetical protein [Enterococcus casseliflavus]AYJ46696.1 hypothetical protein D8N35_16960 [Enterococcus casseliflavus]
MNILKEKIAKAISNHVSLEDTYTYELTRTKSAFEVGTMSLEDFEEWTEENVDDLAKAIVDVLQPQLNDNQQTILDELKINTDYQKFNKFQAVFWLLTTIMQYPDTLLAKAYKELAQDELDHVFQVFSQWAHEQEEEK